MRVWTTARPLLTEAASERLMSPGTPVRSCGLCAESFMGHTAFSRSSRSSGQSSRVLATHRPQFAPSDAGAGHPVAAVSVDAAYSLWAGRCFSVAMAVTANRHLAEEAVQDAFCMWWRQQDKYDPTRSPLGSWLILLTHHRAVDAVRRERRQRRVATTHARDRALHPQAEHSVDAQVISADQGVRVRAAMSILTARQREVLMLAYFGGRTQSEIATMLDIPLGTVKTRSHAALRRLRIHLNDRPEPVRAAVAPPCVAGAR